MTEQPQTYASLVEAHSQTINALIANFEVPFKELTQGRKLGSGNFGEVVLVYFKDLPLACKRLKEDVSPDAASASLAGMFIIYNLLFACLLFFVRLFVICYFI